MPLFAEDAADVSTTKLMMLAAAGTPTATKVFTKGLLWLSMSDQGVMHMMASSAKT